MAEVWSGHWMCGVEGWRRGVADGVGVDVWSGGRWRCIGVHVYMGDVEW